jgi:hypothetical protein
MPVMEQHLHRASAVIFYVLGSTFFLAAVLMRNDIWPTMSYWWLRIADLPFLFAGMVYGGMSVERSLRDAQGKRSMTVLMTITVPLIAIFAFTLFLTFASPLTPYPLL